MSMTAAGARSRAVLVATAALVLLAGLAGPAAAHARLIASDPAGGATVSTVPAELRLDFSERIETSFGGVQVFDPAGARVETGEPQIAGSQARVPLGPLPGPGTYTVVFRVISGDSHPVESRFAFVFQPPPPEPAPEVGESAPPAEQPAEEPSEVPAPAPAGVPKPLDVQLEDAGAGTTVGLWAARLVNYLALTAVVGLLLYAGALLQPGERDAARRRGAAKAAAAVAGVWALSGLALFVFGLSNAAARPLPEVVSGDLPARFAGTRFGYAVLVQAGLALALAVFAAWARSRPALWVAMAIAGLGAFAPGWWGHAGTDDLALLALLSDWAHVLAATAWVGGLAVLAAVFLRRGSELDLRQPLGRFSRVAGWALVVVLATGTVNALTRIGSPGLLFGTAWGRLVLLKLALFAGIAALGWRNRHRVLPRLDTDPLGARKTFRTIALAEVGLMAVAFGAATALSSSVPADAEAASRIQSIATAFGDGQINLTVDPAAVGDNVIHLYFFDANSQLVEVDSPSLTLAGPGTPLEATLLNSGPGHFTVLAQPIPQPGVYQVAVRGEIGGQPRSATGTITVR